MPGDVLLISIRPEYAYKIFDGTKTVELRRVRPRLETGGRVLVYVSNPVQALIGMFNVDRVVESSPTHLWHQVCDNAGVTREQFDLYYKGTDTAYGIFLKSTWQLPRPIYLGCLKQLLSGFKPPQSYRYLSQAEVSLVTNESLRFKRREMLVQMPLSRPPTSRSSLAY